MLDGHSAAAVSSYSNGAGTSAISATARADQTPYPSQDVSFPDRCTGARFGLRAAAGYGADFIPDHDVTIRVTYTAELSGVHGGLHSVCGLPFGNESRTFRPGRAGL